MKTLLNASLLIAALAATSFAQCESSCSPDAATKVALQSKMDIVDTAVTNGNFNTLATALTKAGLVKTLKGKGPFTVFAPTDAAFAKLKKGTLTTLLKPENKGLLTGILTYHVVAGSLPAKKVLKQSGANTVNGQRVNFVAKKNVVLVDGATVTMTDIHCSNGIIHVIDSVILPASDNLIATAVGAGQFKTLAAALKAGGLVGALSSDGPFTVFAPTDAAFAKLPKGTIASLLLPENKDKLAAILKYHVVSGRVYSPTAVRLGAAPSLQGQKLSITVVKGQAMVNNAKIISTDLDASNGVIHVIDSVLLPPATSHR